MKTALLKNENQNHLMLNGDGNENGNIIIYLISKKTNLHVQHTFLVHFFAAVLHDYNAVLHD